MTRIAGYSDFLTKLFGIKALSIKNEYYICSPANKKHVTLSYS